MKFSSTAVLAAVSVWTASAFTTEVFRAVNPVQTKQRDGTPIALSSMFDSNYMSGIESNNDNSGRSESQYDRMTSGPGSVLKKDANDRLGSQSQNGYGCK